MATAAGYFDRKPSSSIRPGLSHLQPDPSSPHTPNRAISSTFSSPSASYRIEEEALVFEFGARHFSAGFTSESHPRCRLGFGPEESRRVGDYRRWLPGYEERTRKRTFSRQWGDDHELWRMDLRGFDLGLVEDKVERAVREAYTKHLLLDSKSRKMFIVLPSLMPHQLLSTVLYTLFRNFQMPSITLLSPPILATVAAGCRSGLIVDIGWRETVVTAICEYREMHQARTTRAMRLATLEMARMLARYDNYSQTRPRSDLAQTDTQADSESMTVDLEQAEEVTARMAWCRGHRASNVNAFQVSSLTSNISDFAEESDGEKTPTEAFPDDSPPITIPSPSHPRKGISIPFSAFSLPVETAFFAPSAESRKLDDNEQPLDTLIYKSLLTLAPDIRALCMSRIILTGGGARILGLKSRLLCSVTTTVDVRGWDGVIGKAADERRRANTPTPTNTPMPTPTPKSPETSKSTPKPVSQLPQTPDPIADRILLEQSKGSKPVVAGVIRGVETLGAWAGASLLGSLRVKGITEIERDTFLALGLQGGRKGEGAENGVRMAAAKSFGPGSMAAAAGRPGERVSWTLGGWA